MRFCSSIFTLALLIFCCLSCNVQPTQNSTPTGTLKTFIEAARKSDTANIRQNLSKKTLEILDQAAQSQKTTIDEMFSPMVKQANAVKDSPIETRNEQINGDTASVELKNPVTGGWDKLPFVRENGQWKYALDKLAEEAEKEVDETK